MDPERKVNCWEFLKCGREPGGKRVVEEGVCPAPVETSVDGINGGRNGGRCCWAVAGTLCFGKVQGTYAKKNKDCLDCGFYWTVADEEPEFYSSISSSAQFYRLIFQVKGLLRGLSRSILSRD